MFRAIPWLVFVLAVGGCASSRFPEDEREAERAIERAEDAGAKEHSRDLLRSAEETLDLARRAEERAIDDRKESRERLEVAQKRSIAATQKVDLRRHALQQEDERRRSEMRALDRIDVREEELRAKAIPEPDIRALIEPERGMANARVKSSDAAIAALEKEIELLELESKDAKLELEAARARKETADQRLAVARALYERAREQARVAEFQALEARRTEMRARLASDL